MPRVDIPAKVTGGAAYVQDMRLPGMLHARVVRQPSPGAVLQTFDAGPVERMPGVVKVVRDGSYLAVVAAKEWQAIKAGAGAGRRRALDRDGAACRTRRRCSTPSARCRRATSPC